MTTFLILILIAAGVVLYFANKQPNEFRVTRSLTMNAPVSVVFGHVNNLRKWQTWSPWVRLDPNANISFEGPEEGMGALNRWQGKKTGEGSMEIIESRPDSRIKFQLDFIKPFPATSYAEFNFTSVSGGTLVTWSMYGTNNIIAKVMSLFMSCEQIIGAQFETGLHHLKEVAERG